jgi:GNAT superfamily N-acetyltransferase
MGGDLGDPAVLIEMAGYGDPEVQALVERVQAEYVVRYGGPDRTPVDPAEFAAPDGTFLVARAEGEVVACGGFRRHDATACEVKRMFVPPEHRGHGYARALLGALEESAREYGYRRVLLETGVAQPEAIGLYEAAGYARVPGFGLYRNSPNNRCYGKEL